MPDEREIEEKFWKALKSDRTVMLGVAGLDDDGHAQPMAAIMDDDHPKGPIWFFTSKDNGLVRSMREGTRAMAHFVSKGHDLFANIHGSLTIDTNRSTVDRLWNPYVAAWFEGGKDDPKLQLLRLDADSADIWLDASSLVAGIKMFFGADPKEEYKDKVATVAL